MSVFGMMQGRAGRGRERGDRVRKESASPAGLRNLHGGI